ncbi:MAG: response regulator transcription factor, partial [Proteobacteria bacterium]
MTIETQHSKVKVLLVEDDSQISKSLSMSLNYSGFDVTTAESLTDAWIKYAERKYDILLLDVNLPDGTGIEFCEKLRGSGQTVPVLFLSARTDEETVVKSMSIGGDDYIRKPFGTEELKMRMGKIMKRSDHPKNILEAGSLKMDLEKRTVTAENQIISLGKREFDILSILVKKSGDIVTREFILSSLDEKSDLYDRTVDSHMSHLRRKLRET